MKHQRDYALMAAMGTLIAERLVQQSDVANPDFLTSIPTHWGRRAIRGVSGPEIMAEIAASHLQRRLARRLLRCRRKTSKQSMLSPAQRRRNVRGAFRLAPGYPLDGRHVVLIDDIVTTGATASEAAKVLTQAGVGSVTVAVVARALPPG